MKKYVQLFEEFSAMNESSGDHPYGCAMVYFDYPKLFELQKKIDPKDLAKDGLEDEPHVTLLYGIHDGGKHKELAQEKLDELIETCKPVLGEKLTMKEVSAFKNDENDVLKIDVDSPKLFEVNKKLSEFPNTNDFPDYHPHCTIAYLKPSLSKKYIEMFENDISNGENSVQPYKIVYSRPNGEKIEWKL